VEIDWKQLTAVATAAMQKAYAPYSKYPVGAAALTEDGRIISGCGKLVAFACVDGRGEALMPCGRCRQLLFEHAADGMLVQTISGIKTIDEVLPDAFGPKDLQ
jgi:cytidine deaminase